MHQEPIARQHGWQAPVKPARQITPPRENPSIKGEDPGYKGPLKKYKCITFSYQGQMDINIFLYAGTN